MSSTNRFAVTVQANGKFLSSHGQKFFLKAMRVSEVGGSLDFDQKLALRRRFDEFKAGHTNCLILTYGQAEPLLGLAAQAGLSALVELTVSEEELLSRNAFHSARARIARAANSLRVNRALIGFLIDCRLEPDLLREHGPRIVKRRLRELLRTIRRIGGARLVALNHRPATCGLALLEEDFIYATLPSLDAATLREYVIRLHNLAESRPLIVEFETGLPGQDELVSCAFGLGSAGVVAPVTQPAASHGWLGIRMLSAGELLPFVTLDGACPPLPPEAPMVSVVICAYNAERTMRPCLESLRRLNYPNCEIIIVDDGSRDRTAEIAGEFPEFRLIRQPNRGLSVARNVGMQAARGEIVAYTDSDCVADPDWLTYAVRSIIEGHHDACGGPNYAPHEDGWVEACVAASPGAPCHVLTADDRAEHLAGCNMMFRKAALLSVGGFDPRFTSAGDDVDICWRLLDAGFNVGFCPAAFVWHFRRNTVKAYYGQQRGYGRAEAMLYVKYPARFNALGQIRWRGTIPGFARTVPGGSQPRMRWTRDLRRLQDMRDEPLSVLKVLPLTLEWNLVGVIALVASMLAGITLLPALAMMAMGPLWALHYARKAPVEKCHDGIGARLFVTFLAYTGPISRTLARYRHSLAGNRTRPFDLPPRQRPKIKWMRRMLRLTYWNENWTTRESLLERIAHFFAHARSAIVVEAGWNDVDLTVRPDRWTRIEFKSADEEHSGNRIKTHVIARVRLSTAVHIGVIAGAIGSIVALQGGFTTAAMSLAVICLALLGCAASELIESGRLAYRVIEQSASELNLIPLGQSPRAMRRAQAASDSGRNRGNSPEAQPAGR